MVGKGQVGYCFFGAFAFFAGGEAVSTAGRRRLMGGEVRGFMLDALAMVRAA
jgi:hypothetical protein